MAKTIEDEDESCQRCIEELCCRCVLCFGKSQDFDLNGQNDVVVNNAGVLQYLNSLSWAGIAQEKWTRKAIWTVHGDPVGWGKMSGNLWFAMVNVAGHMVPTDQPVAALNL